LDNRLKLQTVCKLMGSEAQTYFMYDCPRLKVANKIYYQLENEQA
jgi:phage FluMu protein Com